MQPGEYFLDQSAGDIHANENRRTESILIVNTGDRPIQVGSHYHFFEVNRALKFNRAAAYGRHLNIAAGTAARFEPGEEKEITLVDFGGSRIILGHQGLVNGSLDDDEIKAIALERQKGAS